MSELKLIGGCGRVCCSVTFCKILGSFTAVPSDARKGIISLLAVMVGFSFTSSSMVTGANMGLNSDLLNFIYALLLGGIFLSIYTGILAYIGGRTGLSFDLLCRRAFGRFGSMLPSLLLTLGSRPPVSHSFSVFRASRTPCSAAPC